MPEPEFHDQLDWVRHYWVDQDLGDPRLFVAMGSMLRLHQLMTAEMDRTLSPFDLNRTGYLLLATLQLSSRGERLLSQLASFMLVHPTTITLVADKLEAQGLVKRVAHPTDRRAKNLSITPAGRALIREATRALEKVDFGLPGLTPAKAEKFSDLLKPIRLAAGDH